MNGWASLAKYAMKHPFKTGANALGYTALAGIGINAITHPIDTVTNVATAGAYGTAIASNASSETARGVVGAAALGYGAYKFRAPLAKAGGAIINNPLTRGTVRGMDYLATKAARAPGNLAAGGAKAFAGVWDRFGWKGAMGGAAVLGAAFGAIRAVGNVSLNAPVYDSAMARSEEGSAYEGGPQAFGKRTSRARTMGESALGLVQGLGRRAHG